MEPYFFAWVLAGWIAGHIAYHVRREAGQSRWHAVIQSIITFLVPLVIFQDLEHARIWKSLISTTEQVNIP